MSEDHRSIASFVIRFTQHLWKDEQDEPHVQWRGHISHVQGNEEESFTDLSESLEFIQRHLTQLTLDATSHDSQSDQDKALQESFQFWEKYSQSISELMFDSMEQTLLQSGAVKQQMDEAVGKALKAWQLESSAEDPEIVNALSQLSKQVQKLAEKIETLDDLLEKDS